MDKEQKKAVIRYIKEKDPKKEVIKVIKPNDSWNGGTIQYNGNTVHLHREISSLGDEEYVRAYLVVKLIKELGYVGQGTIVELEKSYSIGRPSKKSARVDLLVRYPNQWPDPKKAGNLFLFVECKAPGHFDADMDFLKGQLFDLSKQEEPKPEFGVYYTIEFDKNEIIDRNIIVNFGEFPSWEAWDALGQPAYSVIPQYFGTPKSIEYANLEAPFGELRPLRTDVTRAEFDRLRKEFHDVIWGGGGTNNNDVFVILIRLFLCRVFDELETKPSQKYRFQRASYENGAMESPDEVVANMTALFREAARTYLGYSESEILETVPFEAKKISASKVAFVVEQLQDKSLTRNTHRGDSDLLGDFFEGIVSQDFTQTKGQFFTHVNLVNFCIKIAGFQEAARHTFLNERDPQGRPRIPKVIDPSCGSGTFLNEAMKAGTSALTPLREAGTLPKRLKEYASMWFGEDSQNGWAREFIYGIEPNADLGLASKVNMILHGDGSTNIFVKSGLEPFSEYVAQDRSHGLAITRKKNESFPYKNVCNEEFDFIFTNPPFSITLSDDEKKKLNKNFYLGGETASENLFIERWYQLLRPSGHFVAVVPETVLDSSSSLEVRLFLFKYFKIEAAISLPYVAFKPFTSTKTCILMAQKKPDEDVEAWNSAWQTYETEYKKLVKGYKSKDDKQQLSCAKRLLSMKDLSKEDMLEKWAVDLEQLSKDGSAWIFRQVATCPDVDNYEIFFAEPHHVGYKRRKGLPDLEQPNDLARVLDCFLNKKTENLRFGFWGRLSELAVRPSLRLDPKYVHLWTKRGAVAFPNSAQNIYLAELLAPYKGEKLPKGSLERPRKLLDLANVESKMSIVSGVTEVEEIGSDKIEFGQADIAISKLEPYLGKVLIVERDEEWIGSPEWLTYKFREKIYHPDYLRFLLLTPQMLEVYRCLQSGKRHARMSESDLLALKIPDLNESMQRKIASQCKKKMGNIQKKRAEIDGLREEINSVIYSASPSAVK
jgi:type I restriction enzyme M protein